jgi:hypothetical protein
MKAISNKKELSPEQCDKLLAALKARFDANQDRHPGLVWAKVQARLEAKPDKLSSLNEMERTGANRMWLDRMENGIRQVSGRPARAILEKQSGSIICSPKIPLGFHHSAHG